MNGVFLCQKVYLCLEERNFPNALKLLGNLLQKDKKDFYAYYLMGWCYEKLGKTGPAQTSYACAYKINKNFLDIDEKVHGYEKKYLNTNAELVNIIKWMSKTASINNLDKLIAKAALFASNEILKNRKTVKSACCEIFNEKIQALAIPHIDKTCSIIFELGLELKNNSFLKPWEVYQTAQDIKSACLAILDKAAFEKHVLSKQNFTCVEIELIKREKITPAASLLQRFFPKASEEQKTNIIKALGILKHEKSSFFLLNYLKNSPVEHIYDTALAISRIGDKNISDALSKYLKKYSNSDLAPLLFVCLCRLEKGKDGLIKLCNNANIGIREEALTQLGDYKGKDVVKTLLQGLFDREKISDFYPIRFVAYEKLGELGFEYLKSVDNNFSSPGNIKELEKIFNEEAPQIEWVYALINSL
jgi:tetratricopeptide (TPR) repeat protein